MFSLFLFFLGVGSWRWKLAPYGRSRRMVLGVCILAALVCIVVAGTRMGMGLTVVGLLLLIIEPVWKTEKSFLIRRTQIRQALALLVPVAALFGMLQIFSDTGTFFLYTTAGGVKEHWSQFTQGQLPNALTKASWVGFGTGALSQGLGHVPGGEEAFQFASRESEGVGVEYGLAKVTWELGVVGLALFLLLWGRIFWTLWTSLRAVRDPSIKGLSSALGTFLLLVFLAFLKGHYYLGDGTTLVLYWFGMGMSFSLVRLDRLEAARAQSMKVRA
jgi:hypothetical protein